MAEQGCLLSSCMGKTRAGGSNPPLSAFLCAPQKLNPNRKTKDSSHGNPVQLVIVVKTAKSAHIIAKSGAAVIFLWRFASQRIAMFRLRLAVLATLLAFGENAEAATKAIKFGKL